MVVTREQLAKIWLLTSVLAVAITALTWRSAYWNGEVLPVGNDAFYHARRIIDTAEDPRAFYEFDPRIHAPEGSLLTWPWAYDYSLGLIAWTAVRAGLVSDPMQILVWLPVAAVTLAIWLLLLICSELRLSAAMTTLAGLCMALSPTTQSLFGVGQLDHHFAEGTLVLAALALGLRWLREPTRTSSAVHVGITLGIAPAIHNGLFILQLPLLVSILGLWIQKRSLPTRAGLTFAIALVVTTLLVLLPSLSFRSGAFEFYTLSWFHLFIACCTGAIVSFTSFFRCAPRSIAALCVAATVMSLPVLTQLSVAETFLAGKSVHLQSIVEMQPPYRLIAESGAATVNSFYSLTIWLAPAAALFCALMCWRERDSYRSLFWISAIGGLALLLAQLRLHYFGYFALFLPWLFLLDQLAAKYEAQRKQIVLGALLAFALAYSPSRHQLLTPMPVAGDATFTNSRGLYAALQKACADDPGVVLADNNAGHYIRYFTECSVIANNFLLTRQHADKVEEVARLFSLAPASLVAEAPFVKYVLVRPLAVREEADGRTYDYQYFYRGSNTLTEALLLRPNEQTRAGYELLTTVSLDGAGVPYGALYKVHPRSSSANTVKQ